MIGDVGTFVHDASAGEAIAPFLGDDAGFGDVGQSGVRYTLKFFQGGDLDILPRRNCKICYCSNGLPIPCWKETGG